MSSRNPQFGREATSSCVHVLRLLRGEIAGNYNCSSVVLLLTLVLRTRSVSCFNFFPGKRTGIKKRKNEAKLWNAYVNDYHQRAAWSNVSVCVPLPHFRLFAVRLGEDDWEPEHRRDVLLRGAISSATQRRWQTSGSCAGSPVTDSHPPGSHLAIIACTRSQPLAIAGAPVSMHVISTLLVLLALFQHQTSRHFLLVHAITSGGSTAPGDERDSFLLHHPSPERGPTHDAFPESQHHFPKTVTSDSSAIAQNGAENNSNSFATLLRVEDVTSKSIKVRLETRSGASPLVPQKIFFKNIQRNSDWKHFVVDEKRHRDENGSVLLTNLLCGNKYQVYGASIDREGQTSASQVLLTKTAGREPLAPPVTTPFRLSPFS